MLELPVKDVVLQASAALPDHQVPFSPWLKNNKSFKEIQHETKIEKLQNIENFQNRKELQLRKPKIHVGLTGRAIERRSVIQHATLKELGTTTRLVAMKHEGSNCKGKHVCKA